MLQEDFFKFLKEAFSQRYLNLNSRETKKWHKCYVDEKTVCWMQKPNKDGSFWVFVSLNHEDIQRRLNDCNVDQNQIDKRKYYISLLDNPMSQIELLDRGISATGGWEASWPVGFKIKDNNQFELAKRIIFFQ